MTGHPALAKLFTVLPHFLLVLPCKKPAGLALGSHER
jgi:hypothetical protein